MTESESVCYNHELVVNLFVMNMFYYTVHTQDLRNFLLQITFEKEIDEMKN